MKIIIVDQKHGDTKTLILKGWVRIALSICLLGLPILLGYCGYQLSASRNAEFFNDDTAQTWSEKLDAQEQQIKKAKAEALAQIQAMTLQMAKIQASLLRVDALGQHITAVADIESSEFDFSQEPAVGGPQITGDESGHIQLDLLETLDKLSWKVDDRRQQLEILNSLLTGRQSDLNTFLAGSPVKKGYISSHFGSRIDPFTGNQAWHEGVDFATGQVGVEVQAVASGLVTFAGEKSGYGLMVEINHANGYQTLYAHDQEVLVNPGDIVKKGQIIALSGNSGRSTGPHVHFEVHKNGRVVDPASYIHRTNR